MQVKPAIAFTDDEREKLTRRIQNGGTEVVEAKAGTVCNTSTLSRDVTLLIGLGHALDGARRRPVRRLGEVVASPIHSLMRSQILRGLSGEANVIEAAYVESTVTAAKFFATPVVLGVCFWLSQVVFHVLQRAGVEKNLGYGTLSAYEADKLAKEVLPELTSSITKGEKFGK